MSATDFSVKVLADSVAPSGKRLTTFECTYPRIIHSEIMTIRMKAIGSASSRALPVEKLIKQVEDHPFVPIWWGKAQPGMQANEEIDVDKIAEAKEKWLGARTLAVIWARDLLALGLHKQIPNRLLEPWMWITVIWSATEWENYFRLRAHPAAEPHFQKLAYEMKRQYEAGTPKQLKVGEWHLPLIAEDEQQAIMYNEFKPVDVGPQFRMESLKKVSVGRCARVSYLTHDGKRDLQADIDLCGKLAENGHWGPYEHVAQAMQEPLSTRENHYLSTRENHYRSGPFIGWKQYREDVDPNFQTWP